MRIERENRLELERLEREEREQKREEERERREARLLTTLRVAKPAVPQRVTINNHNVPQMKESDDLESFVLQLEAALVSLKIPREEWRQYIHSQVTVEAKEKIMHLLIDEEAIYDDIRAGLLVCSAMSFAATAEALFGPMRGEADKLKLRPLASKVKRWAQKLLQEAETLTEDAEKISVGYIRAKLHPDLKNYMDLSKASNIPRYLIKVEEWERSHPEVRSIFKLDHQTSHRHVSSSNFQTGAKRTSRVFTVESKDTSLENAEAD